MTDNANIVKKWVESILDKANSALDFIDSIEVDEGNFGDVSNAYRYVGEIKGGCEAILATMDSID